jgi:hypothetical protein
MTEDNTTEKFHGKSTKDLLSEIKFSDSNGTYIIKESEDIKLFLEDFNDEWVQGVLRPEEVREQARATVEKEIEAQFPYRFNRIKILFDIITKNYLDYSTNPKNSIFEGEIDCLFKLKEWQKAKRAPFECEVSAFIQDKLLLLVPQKLIIAIKAINNILGEDTINTEYSTAEICVNNYTELKHNLTVNIYDKYGNYEHSFNSFLTEFEKQCAEESI